MIVIENMQGTGQRVELRKLVVKLGSAVIAGEGSSVDDIALGAIADSVAALRARGVEVILVSSGAIGMARRQFPEFKARTIPDRQALAAIGQVGLMHAWMHLFNARGFKAAQMLLTRDDMEHRQRYLNARYTLERLLELGAVPVINENDTVTIDELRFGDNDQLSALVATKMNADLLVILSVVDGVLELNDSIVEERPDGSAKRRGTRTLGATIPVLDCLDEKLLALADGTRSGLGTGGMQTKLQAVRMVAQAGLHAAIASGKRPGILEEIATGTFAGTYVPPCTTAHLNGRERWLAFGRQAHGRKLVIDAGASEALRLRHKSLLAAGVRAVEGDFTKGDLVEIVDTAGNRVARGLVNFDAAEVQQIMGKKTTQVREILGDVPYDEVVHRDYMVIY